MHCHHGDKRLQPIKHRHSQFLELATQYHIFLKAHGSDLLLVVKMISLSLHYQVITFVFTNHSTNHFRMDTKKKYYNSLCTHQSVIFRQHRILSGKHLHSLHLPQVTKLRLLQPSSFSQFRISLRILSCKPLS